MAELELLRDGRPGHLTVSDEDAARAANLLRGGGFQVEGLDETAGIEEAAAPEGDLVRLEDCEPERPRPCDLATGIAYVRDLAEAEGLGAGQVRAIIQAGGYRTEDEVRSALVEVVEQAPAGEARVEAAYVAARLFGEGALPGTVTAEERAQVAELLAAPDA